MAESKFQKKFLDKVRILYPGCIIMKNDSGYIQGIPDWTILYKKRWALLEMKDYEGAPVRPNQPYYVDKANDMSYSSFVYPENEDQVLDDLSKVFGKPKK